MSNDKFESMKKRMENRRAEISQRLTQNLGGRFSRPSSMPPLEPAAPRKKPGAQMGEQYLMQAAHVEFGQTIDTVPIGAGLYGDDNRQPANNTPANNNNTNRADNNNANNNTPENNAGPNNKPDAPVGSWRCIVESQYVTVDVTVSIAPDNTLSGQGTIIYAGTLKMFQVSGKGDWVALPPDQDSDKWLFKFRMHPSNHPIFSWFARPTESPNHLANKFVAPNGGVVVTRCEKQG